MGWEAWFTLAVVVAVLVALARERVAPSLAMFGGMVVLLVSGVIETEAALAGFSNPAPLTVAALFVLARAVEKTGVLAPLLRTALGDGGGERRALARLTLPTAAASAFLNNTPLVAMLLPQVSAWAEARRISPSKFLMPLSFAAILGGVVTLIGTSTNIVVSGLMRASGLEPMGFFEIGLLGLPVAVVGLLLLVVLAPRMLPARRSVVRELAEEGRRFVAEMVVEPGGPVDGRTVEEAGLRHLRAGFLATVERDGSPPVAATPGTTLMGGDRLRFVGRADQVADLQMIRGLKSAEAEQLLEFDGRRARYFEAVIGPASDLVGRTLKETQFRSRYGGVVLGIHRSGHLVDAKLGEVPLRVGDTLVVLAEPGFASRFRDSGDFLLLAHMGATPPVVGRRAAVVGVVALAIVALSALGVVDILHAALGGALVLVLAGALTPGEARAAVDLDVVVLIASAFGVAAAVEASGLAAAVAGGLVEVFDTFGARGVLFGVVAATMLLTGAVSNNAAALLMFPVAVTAAAASALDPRGVGMAVAVAASADFLTPIGYQTNTMVYGPGGYRFTDYTRLGAPLSLAVLALTVWLVPLIWS